jgi:hypothetical protein
LVAVRAHYEPQLKDMIERDDANAARSLGGRQMESALRACKNIDNSRILRDVYWPLQHLNTTLVELRQGQPLLKERLDRLRKEIPIVEEFSSDPMRSSYLSAAEQLYVLVGGREKIFPLAPNGREPEGRCDALADVVKNARTELHALLETIPGTPGMEGSSGKGTRQEKVLTEWTRASTDRLLMGCPPLW